MYRILRLMVYSATAIIPFVLNAQECKKPGFKIKEFCFEGTQAKTAMYFDNENEAIGYCNRIGESKAYRGDYLARFPKKSELMTIFNHDRNFLKKKLAPRTKYYFLEESSDRNISELPPEIQSKLWSKEGKLYCHYLFDPASGKVTDCFEIQKPLGTAASVFCNIIPKKDLSE